MKTGELVPSPPRTGSSGRKFLKRGEGIARFTQSGAAKAQTREKRTTRQSRSSSRPSTGSGTTSSRARSATSMDKSRPRSAENPRPNSGTSRDRLEGKTKSTTPTTSNARVSAIYCFYSKNLRVLVICAHTAKLLYD